MLSTAYHCIMIEIRKEFYDLIGGDAIRTYTGLWTGLRSNLVNNSLTL